MHGGLKSPRPIDLAVAYNYCKTGFLLLQNQATPLHVAVVQGYKDIVKIL